VYRRTGAYSSTVGKTRFGSWNKALEAAPLSLVQRRNLSTEELFANIADVWTALGRQPRKRDICKPLSKFTPDPYVTRFGGWLAAMRAFVDYANKEADIFFPGITASPVARGPRDPSLRLRFRILLRDHFRCRLCRRSPATRAGVSLHVDHITAWEQGGPTTYENLQTLCVDCNLGKSNLSVAPYASNQSLQPTVECSDEQLSDNFNTQIPARSRSR
jgi:hypothetical protein